MSTTYYEKFISKLRAMFTSTKKEEKKQEEKKQRDTMSVFARGEAAIKDGAKRRVFDWVEAAHILKQRNPGSAVAGLQDDMELTSRYIWKDGKPYLECDDYPYLASNWTIPLLVINNEELPCWLYIDKSPGWNANTYWPQEALDIINQKETSI